MRKIDNSILFFPEGEKKHLGNQYLKRWLYAFKDELIKYQERNLDDCPWWYGERTTLGWLLNAILQAENQQISFLQEFDSAKKKTKTKGRGDLLILDKKNSFLFEAKKYYSVYNTKGRYYNQPKDEEDEYKFVQKVIDQAKLYEIKELHDILKFQYKQNFVLALCFDTLLFPDPPKGNIEFDNVFQKWVKPKEEALKGIDFYMFYYYSPVSKFNDIIEEPKGQGIRRSYLGMAVYGKIENIFQSY